MQWTACTHIRNTELFSTFMLFSCADATTYLYLLDTTFYALLQTDILHPQSKWVSTCLADTHVQFVSTSKIPSVLAS